MATWATVKKLGKKLPEVEESTWWNTPSLKIEPDELAEVLTESWRRVAPKSVVKTFDEGAS